MHKETSLLARIVALLSALGFVFFITLSIVALTVELQFFRAGPYLRALQQVNAYERAPGILADLFVASFDDNSGLAGQLPLPELGQADVELFLSILLPRDWLQSQSEVVVQRTVAEFNGETPAQPALLSLAELKAQLRGPAGREALVAVVNSRPACGPLDLAAFTCGFDLSGELSCRPPSLNLDVCGAAFDLAVEGIAAQIPEQVDLDAALQFSEPLTAPLRNYVRRYVSAISLTARFGWFLALPFLALTTILAVRSFTGWLRWWGAPLLGVALALIPVAALTLFWPTWYIASPLQEIQTAAPSLATLIGDVATELSRGLALQLAVAILLLGMAGGGMLILSLLVAPLRRWVAQG